MADGQASHAFRNACYAVQRAELDHALYPNDRDCASYFPENFQPITDSEQWQFTEGDMEILPGISASRIPGDNPDIQAVRVTGGGKTLLFVADLIPTRHHISLPWIMAYDLYPLLTLETTRKWIAEIAEKGWVVAFGYNPEHAASTLHQRDGMIEFETVALNR